MNLHDFYYELPRELIAQDPLEDRSGSRLMLLNRETGERRHRVFREITEELHPGDCLVVNDTKVIPARLIGSKEGTEASASLKAQRRSSVGNSGEAGEKGEARCPDLLWRRSSDRGSRRSGGRRQPNHPF